MHRQAKNVLSHRMAWIANVTWSTAMPRSAYEPRRDERSERPLHSAIRCLRCAGEGAEAIAVVIRLGQGDEDRRCQRRPEDST